MTTLTNLIILTILPNQMNYKENKCKIRIDYFALSFFSSSIKWEMGKVHKFDILFVSMLTYVSDFA